MLVGAGCCNNGGAPKKRGGNDGEQGEQGQQIEKLENENVQDGGAKKKGSKVVKRALTPYNKFVKKHFAILKNKFPDEKATQIMKLISVEWKKTKN